MRCDELRFREAKTETARVMELELPHRFQMLARIIGFAGFGDSQNNERGIFLSTNEFGVP